AFALSVVPAILCIVLIVSGQHVAENVPRVVGPNFTDPLPLGITLIWGGNALVFITGVTLLTRLGKV
ncbi:MAG: hypothetical protein AAF656_04450, partial [Planctomycetota bacterium]